MSDRKKAIETLKQLRLDYEEFYEEHNNEVTQAYDMAIASLETDEAYQLEYERTTKNDLGVDAISRAEMLKYQQYLHGKMSNEENHKLWEFIKELPSATPIRPKGHWITRPHVYGVTYCSKCDFELKIDNTNYCPNCGAKMVESQESEDNK